MTKPKKLEELTDEAVIHKLFPKDVVREAKRAAKESDSTSAQGKKPAETKDSD
jgi:hypothetical protein